MLPSPLPPLRLLVRLETDFMSFLGHLLCTVCVETTGNNTVEKAMDNLRIRLQNILSLRDGDDWTYIGDRAVLVMTKDGIRCLLQSC